MTEVLQAMAVLNLAFGAAVLGGLAVIVFCRASGTVRTSREERHVAERETRRRTEAGRVGAIDVDG